jgi:hypothetical protein
MCVKDGPYRCQEQAAFVQVCVSTKPRREPEGESNVHVKVVDQEHRNWVLCQSRCQVLFSAAGALFLSSHLLAYFADGCTDYRPLTTTGSFKATATWAFRQFLLWSRLRL